MEINDMDSAVLETNDMESAVMASAVMEEVGAGAQRSVRSG